jgi:hypothetical protein
MLIDEISLQVLIQIERILNSVQDHSMPTHKIRGQRQRPF